MTGHDVGVVAKVALAIATVYIIWRLATEYGITGKVVLILLLALICFFQNKTIVVVVVFLIWCLWCLLPIGEKNRKEKKKKLVPFGLTLHGKLVLGSRQEITITITKK